MPADFVQKQERWTPRRRRDRHGTRAAPKTLLSVVIENLFRIRLYPPPSYRPTGPRGARPEDKLQPVSTVPAHERLTRGPRPSHGTKSPGSEPGGRLRADRPRGDNKAWSTNCEYKLQP